MTNKQYNYSKSNGEISLGGSYVTGAKVRLIRRACGHVETVDIRGNPVLAVECGTARLAAIRGDSGSAFLMDFPGIYAYAENADRSLSFLEWTRIVIEVLWVLLGLIPHGILKLLREFGFCLPVPKRLVKKVVLVTGAGQGLGRALAYEFGRLGATVVCVDVNASTVNATMAHLRGELVTARAFPCDVSSRRQVQALATRVREEVGPVDILVNNAALLTLSEADGWDSAQRIETMTKVNLLSHFWMIEAFYPHMLEKGEGHIVAISSASALFGLGDAVTYSACKAGVAAMMDAFSDHLRKSGLTKIHTTTVYPYFIRTPLIEGAATLRFPALPVKKVAQQIVKGVREHLRWFTVPGSLAWGFILMKMLPHHLSEKLRKVIYVKLDFSYKEMAES